LLVALLMHLPGAQAAKFPYILIGCLFRGIHVTLIPRIGPSIKSPPSYQ
jgi:hypothetical protein